MHLPVPLPPSWLSRVGRYAISNGLRPVRWFARKSLRLATRVERFFLTRERREFAFGILDIISNRLGVRYDAATFLFLTDGRVDRPIIGRNVSAAFLEDYERRIEKKEGFYLEAVKQGKFVVRPADVLSDAEIRDPKGFMAELLRHGVSHVIGVRVPSDGPTAEDVFAFCLQRKTDVPFGDKEVRALDGLQRALVRIWKENRCVLPHDEVMSKLHSVLDGMNATSENAASAALAVTA